MPKRFKIDQFYLDATYGVVKFVGYHETGKLMFERYEKSMFTRGKYSGWLPVGQRVNLDPEFQNSRVKRGRVRAIPPPQ